MQSATAIVSEGMTSTMVCAIISGVSGNLEDAVDATLTLTGSTKAGPFAFSFRYNTNSYTLKVNTTNFVKTCMAQLLDKCHHADN